MSARRRAGTLDPVPVPAAAGAAALDASPRDLAGMRLLLTFDGLEPGPGILDAIRRRRCSGVTIFRAANVESPPQLRTLGAALQAARPAGDPPLIIGFDQEGGQLQTIDDGATAWPGNLALGAIGSADVARRAGCAIGEEVAAMGGTLVYAPVCDILQGRAATPLGTRPFGDDPALVARLAAAFASGLLETGVAAVLKHFPGHGAAFGDSHATLPVVRRSLDELRAFELVPFRAGIAAGAPVVMPGHLAVPAVDGAEIPATVSAAVIEALLRDELGFAGVTVSDALDMAGGAFGGSVQATVCAAAGAGMDLLLLKHDPRLEEAAFEALADAITSERLDRGKAEAAHERIWRLRSGLAGIAQPGLDVVGSEAHRRLAREIADASITLVRDPGGAIPIHGDRERVAIVAPVPVDLTPAETSSFVRFDLAGLLRVRGIDAVPITMPLDPTPAEIAAIAMATRGHAAVVACTYDAVSHPGQAALVEALAAASRDNPRSDGGDRAIVAVALRTPYDVAVVPAWIAVACTFGVQPPQAEALADALVGRIPFAGRLPVDPEVAA